MQRHVVDLLHVPHFHEHQLEVRHLVAQVFFILVKARHFYRDLIHHPLHQATHHHSFALAHLVLAREDVAVLVVTQLAKETLKGDELYEYLFVQLLLLLSYLGLFLGVHTDLWEVHIVECVLQQITPLHACWHVGSRHGVVPRESLPVQQFVNELQPHMKVVIVHCANVPFNPVIVVYLRLEGVMLIEYARLVLLQLNILF